MCKFLPINTSFLSLPFLLLSLLILPPSSSATSSTDEIFHLLQFVEQSDCTFIRNGTSHSSKEAKEHLERKYHYIKKRISSPEEFIKYAATKSSITRKPYYVICNEEKILSSFWLSDELQRYRVSTENTDADNTTL